jgi:hypothetical protein
MTIPINGIGPWLLNPIDTTTDYMLYIYKISKVYRFIIKIIFLLLSYSHYTNNAIILSAGDGSTNLNICSSYCNLLILNNCLISMHAINFLVMILNNSNS